MPPDEPSPIPPPEGRGTIARLYLLLGVKFQALCRDVLDNDQEISECEEYGINGRAQRGTDLETPCHWFPLS
jgi:hypothetical protein